MLQAKLVSHPNATDLRALFPYQYYRRHLCGIMGRTGNVHHFSYFSTLLISKHNFIEICNSLQRQKLLIFFLRNIVGLVGVKASGVWWLHRNGFLLLPPVALAIHLGELAVAMAPVIDVLELQHVRLFSCQSANRLFRHSTIPTKYDRTKLRKYCSSRK